MQIDIQYFNAEPDWETKRFISEKLFKLQFRYKWIMGMKVYLKDENHDRNKSKVVELKLEVPDETLFSSARGENFHIAAKDALAGLATQLQKYRMTKKVPFAYIR